MPKTRYESKKPIHQTKPHHSQPPMGSIAVFEWETFKPLPDFSDKSLNEVFKQISRDIIERPYHYDAHKAFNANGDRLGSFIHTGYAFTKAGNSAPPDKIPGIAVYKQNHGTGHAIRQMVYTDTLIDKIAQEGNAKGQDIAQKINANPEIKSILKIAAYCKRIGRTFDHEHDDHGYTTVYSQRSADMFAKMTAELGYNPDLIKAVSEGMLEPRPKTTTLTGKDIGGIKDTDLKDFSESVLMAAHMADLARLFTVRRNYIETSLKSLFDPVKLPQISTQLVEMACKANAMTGNPVVQQESGVKHQTAHLNGKKLVDVVTNIDQAINDLAQVKWAAPSIAPITRPKAHASSQVKNVFAFDIDDTLIEEHTFRVHGGPKFDRNEMAKIKAKMADAINNGDEVWIVTANWGYQKAHMQKLFDPDPSNLLGKIKFFNAIDIAQELNIPSHKLQDIHTQGKKGEFLAKKIAEDPALKDHSVNCVLFDDTESQINNCSAHSSEKIKIEGYRVDDYKAKKGKRAIPIHSLSEVFSTLVNKSISLGADQIPTPLVDVQMKPQPLDFQLGRGHRVTGITPNPGLAGGFIVHAKNSADQYRSIQVHADGSIRNFKGEKEVAGYVDGLMKDNVVKIFAHFNIDLPKAVKLSNQANLPKVIPQDILEKHEQQLKTLLKDLEVKAKELQGKAKINPQEYTKIAAEVQQLYTTLTSKMSFFKNPTAEGFSQFKKDYVNAIETVENNSREHRGWHRVHPILRGIVGIIAALAVIPALVVMKESKHGYLQTFFAKPETDTTQRLGNLKNKFQEQAKEMDQEIKESTKPSNP